MMPWMLDARKLSESAFMVRRYTPTTFGVVPHDGVGDEILAPSPESVFIVS